MNRSKPGLNEPFYKWLDDVRRAIRKEKELLEKLEYYNMKFVGYKGVNYERIGSSSSSGSGDKELLYWLEKIDDTENKLSEQINVINAYAVFNSTLTNLQQDVLKDMHLKINRESSLSISKSYRHQILNSIVVKWLYEIVRKKDN